MLEFRNWKQVPRSLPHVEKIQRLLGTRGVAQRRYLDLYQFRAWNICICIWVETRCGRDNIFSTSATPFKSVTQIQPDTINPRSFSFTYPFTITWVLSCHTCHIPIKKHTAFTYLLSSLVSLSMSILDYLPDDSSPSSPSESLDPSVHVSPVCSTLHPTRRKRFFS